MGELIAVLSGKGGTGKSSLCAGISTALASQNFKVLCIDCDVGLRNLDIPLGMSDQAALSFLDICSRGYPLSKAAHHPDFPTLHFLTAPMNCPAEQVNMDDFSAMLQQTRDLYDYVFLDAPAGLDAGFQLAARFADRILLVTGPDPAAVRDAGRTGDTLDMMGKHDVRLIVNRINKRMVKAMSLTVDDIMDQAGLPLLGIVPEDPHVVLAASFGTPLIRYGNRGAAAACRRIAKRIQGKHAPISL